jgi:hypothetical protein
VIFLIQLGAFINLYICTFSIILIYVFLLAIAIIDIIFVHRYLRVDIIRIILVTCDQFMVYKKKLFLISFIHIRIILFDILFPVCPVFTY